MAVSGICAGTTGAERDKRELPYLSLHRPTNLNPPSTINHLPATLIYSGHTTLHGLAWGGEGALKNINEMKTPTTVGTVPRNPGWLVTMSEFVKKKTNKPTLSRIFEAKALPFLIILTVEVEMFLGNS